VRDGAGGSTVVEHEGSVAGYQSLLLLVPAERIALAVLTNSWRGSALIRLVVEELGLLPRPSRFRSRRRSRDATRSTTRRPSSRRRANGSP
jgi:hypothetical protein